MAINVLKPTPDFDINLKFEDVHIPALNDFFKAYAKVDLKKGNFNMYSELALRNGAITGYVKSIARDLQFIDWQDKEETCNVGHLAWEGIAGLVAELFKNHPKDQLATTIPISGSIKENRIDTWTAVLEILRNGFIKTLPMETDGTVTFSDAINAYRKQLAEGDDSGKNTKAERKEERKKRREERRKERQEKRESGQS